MVIRLLGSDVLTEAGMGGGGGMSVQSRGGGGGGSVICPWSFSPSASIIGGGGGGPSSSSERMMSPSGLVGQLGTTGGGTAFPKLELRWWEKSSYENWYRCDVRITIRNDKTLYGLLRNRLVIKWGEGRSMRQSGSHRTLDRLWRTAASTWWSCTHRNTYWAVK